MRARALRTGGESGEVSRWTIVRMVHLLHLSKDASIRDCDKPGPTRHERMRLRGGAYPRTAIPLAADSTALTEAVATSLSVPMPKTVRPSGVRHST